MNEILLNPASPNITEEFAEQPDTHKWEKRIKTKNPGLTKIEAFMKSVIQGMCAHGDHITLTEEEVTEKAFKISEAAINRVEDYIQEYEASKSKYSYYSFKR